MNIIRVKKEFKKCYELEKVSIFFIDENILKWKVLLTPSTKIFDGAYEILITVPEKYPFDAPVVSCLSKIFHPNIDGSGKICLQRLNEWSTSYTLEHLLLDILELFEKPNLNDPINLKAASLWGTKEYLEWM